MNLHCKGLAAAAFALALAGVANPQTPVPGATPKVTEWPALKDSEKDRVLALAGQLRKEDAKLHEDAKKGLLQIGAGGAGLLLQQVSDREDRANELLFEVFDAMLTPAHAALMAREAKKPKTLLRRYLALRMSQFHDKDLAGAFEAMRKDKDEQTVFYAELGLLSLGRREVVPTVLAYTKTRWKDVGELVAKALAPARSREHAEWVFEAIAKAPAADQMAGLRLLRYLMVKEQSVILRTYLEAADHTVKREAVNAARVLHGEAPIENLDVFQVIGHAKDWLKKL